MIRFLFFLFFVFVFRWAAGQSTTDVVVLKDGRQLQGTIISQIPQVSLTISASDGSVTGISWGDIERVTKLQQPVSQSTDTLISTNRWMKRIELGYAAGLNAASGDFLRVGALGVWPFSNIFSLQFGAGLHVHDSATGVLLPLRAGCLLALPFGRFTPVIGLSGGYSMAISERFKGVGLFLSPSVEVAFINFGSTTLNLAISYELQWFNQSVPGRNSAGGYVIKKEVHLERASGLSVVVEF